MNDEKFQSTLPVWGATAEAAYESLKADDFNPRSPCGERRHGICGRSQLRKFQSTLPVWGATSRGIESYGNMPEISIHAPRVGSDADNQQGGYCMAISIHAPRVGSDCMLLR